MKPNGIDNLEWTFTESAFADASKFEIALRAQNEEVPTEDWNPTAVAANVSELLLQYMCYVESPSDLLANEHLSESDEKTFEEYPDEKFHQVDVFAKLKADNNEYFTVAELLFKAHNQLASKKLGDHVFFEELGPEPQSAGGLPVYYLSAGS